VNKGKYMYEKLTLASELDDIAVSEADEEVAVTNLEVTGCNASD
jgi:hypothetical protein